MIRLQQRRLLSVRPRINPVGIQHLSEELQEQLFPDSYKRGTERLTKHNALLIKLAHEHLRANQLLGKKCSISEPIKFELPKLQGQNLAEHFYRLGMDSLEPYQEIIKEVMNIGRAVQPMPKKWLFKSGWTRYAPGKKPEAVPYPSEKGLIYDVEVLYKISKYPVIATAYSNRAWYGWVSPYLTGESDTLDGHLIPMNVQNEEKIIIGHNVSYDRARILEEYDITQSKAFYLDTMSLHVAVSGMCSRQKGKWMKYHKMKDEEKQKEGSLVKFREEVESESLKELIDNPNLDADETLSSFLEDDPWLRTSSLNGLQYVAHHHCGINITKETRDQFSTTNPQEIIENFQKLMEYCATDVVTTYRVFHKVYPEFRELVPHPVSLAALRHISQSFLPTNEAWEKYITRTEQMYQDSVEKIENNLKKMCEQVVSLKDDPSQPWLSDPWLSQLDWTIIPPKLTKKGTPYRRQKMPGYPEWYKKLFSKDNMTLTPKSRVTPLLLKLSWEGKPVYWLDSKGWCFLVDKGEEEKYKKKNYTYLEPARIVEEGLASNPDFPELLQTKSLFKVPHEEGPESRTTTLMSKPFLRYFEQGILSSEYDLAKDALNLAVRNSYWISSRERIMNQFVVYKKDAIDSKIGMIIPQIIPMGTITRRAVENTWLTASNAKKSRLGSELKAMIQSPPGYCFVGADVDSEELWVASLVGDSVFKIHGGTAIGWMTLEGTKSEGTDLHSKTAKILGISRNDAKVFNYGRIYGAGVKFATSLLKKFNPALTEADARKTASELYAATKGQSQTVNKRKMWFGGSESIVFNRLETIAEQEHPKTPVLGAGITSALQKKNLHSNTFLPSRINWAIQSSGVDYLHLLVVSMEYLLKRYKVDARLCITVHDEIRYIVKKEQKYKCAMILQIANLWTRAMFCHQLGIDEVPQSCAFFSAVDIDHVLRKEVDLDCCTPSNPTAIPPGEALTIVDLLEKPEIQEFLTSIEEVDLSQYPVPKTVKPSDLLDQDLKGPNKSLMIKLQIATSLDEFKKLRRLFTSNLRRNNTKFMEDYQRDFENFVISSATLGDMGDSITEKAINDIDLDFDVSWKERSSKSSRSKNTSATKTRRKRKESRKITDPGLSSEMLDSDFNFHLENIASYKSKHHTIQA
ncbi:hypothetical protein KL938_003708 [Ogataea parapolymorpha]|nr:hypothetical protein KL938_003708 [Ogataea parapolymorpha]